MKRSSPDPPSTATPPRDIEIIRRDIDEAERVKKEAEKTYYALKRELDAHPETRIASEKASEDRIRSSLPLFLYNELVLKDPRLDSLFVFLMYDIADDGPYAYWEMSLYFTNRHHTFTLGVEGNKFDPFEEDYKIPTYQKDVEKVWAKSLQLNKGDVPRALAGILACAAIKNGNVDVGSDVLAQVWGEEEEEEECSSTDIY